MISPGWRGGRCRSTWLGSCTRPGRSTWGPSRGGRSSSGGWAAGQRAAPGRRRPRGRPSTSARPRTGRHCRRGQLWARRKLGRRRPRGCGGWECRGPWGEEREARLEHKPEHQQWGEWGVTQHYWCWTDANRPLQPKLCQTTTWMFGALLSTYLTIWHSSLIWILVVWWCDVHTRLVCHLCSKSYLQHQPVESGHYQDQLIEVNELTLTAWQKTDLWLWLVNITDSRYGNNQTQLACFPCALVLLVSFSLSCPASIDLVKLVGGRPCNTADLCLEPSDLQTPPLTSLPLRTFHYF